MKMTKIQHERRIKVLDKIYAKGPLSRIDISQQTGITPATVSDITADMIEEKLIYELGEENPKEVRSGRKKILLNISGRHSFYIGIELSEKFLSLVLCDNLGEIYEKKEFQTTSFPDVVNEENLYRETQTFLQECHAYQPSAIGIALPGHFDEGNLTIQTNNPFWKKFHFKKMIEAFELPIYFENNVECMAITERLFGENSHDENFTFLHVARGMFCSSIYQGQLYGTENILVGEIGHIIVHPEGELCECGRRGCLQTYASEAWIIKKSQILFDNSESTYLRQLSSSREDVSIEKILKAYQLGDEGVINILHNAIKYLSITINNVSMMIDSNKMLIHGRLFNEPQLLALLKEYMEQQITLLAKEKKQQLKLKKYHITNGAVAACGLCVSRHLLT
ncbi:ROK family transcriptional regulator [Vagococcus elongatus]|uniref:HTH marR-type domain-containing protein n=1 Tax=Vagococcus elongatus TaxID=180344 RepID=A0A430B1Y3_9ENTE|nr:ROK family transcriptional regulator [Vagococcus elongatus]RSU14330.1 hypothetical protein CBF29_03250 [Vagococcus elongatus]